MSCKWSQLTHGASSHVSKQIVAQSVEIEELERLDFFPVDDIPLEPESNTANNGQVIANGYSAASQKENGTVRASMWTEFIWLAKRDFRGIKRNPMTLGSRLGLSAFMSILTGLIFWQVGGKETDDPIVSQVKSSPLAIGVVEIESGLILSFHHQCTHPILFLFLQELQSQFGGAIISVSHTILRP
jgi:hypothetical protein